MGICLAAFQAANPIGSDTQSGIISCCFTVNFNSFKGFWGLMWAGCSLRINPAFSINSALLRKDFFS
jgi:hypothetical protein